MDQGVELSSFEPVQRRRVFEEVVVQIENAIYEGRLSVGDRLPPERELAEIFRVSRPSVREALRVLEAFGVVTIRRGTGRDSVAILSAQNLSHLSAVFRLYASLLGTPLADLLETRVTLELLAVRRAAQRATREDVDRLRGLAEQMGACEMPQEFLALDTDFHMALGRASGNSALPLIMGALRDAIAQQMLRAFGALQQAGGWAMEKQRLVAEHGELAEMIGAGEGEAAAQLCAQHVLEFYSRVLFEQGEGQPILVSLPFGRP